MCLVFIRIEDTLGKNIVNELKEKDSIGWVFLETEQEATEGGKSGIYYAAIVIDVDFTYGMYHGVKDYLCKM